MKLIPVFLLFCLALADEPLRLGKLVIFRIGSLPASKNLLSAFDEIFVLNDRASIFGFDKKGSLKLFSSGKYLNIIGGRLILSDTPQCGFRLSNHITANGRRRLSFSGRTSFQLCRDHLVGFRSRCQGARTVMIGFEELI